MSNRFPLFFILFLLSNVVSSQKNSFSGFLLNTKIGLGSGYNFYVGPSGDGKITFDEGGYSELKHLTDFYVVNAVNKKWDIGFRVANGAFWSKLVKTNDIAFESHFNEMQLIANKKLTNSNYKKNALEIEMLFGIGFAYFHSRMSAYIFDNPLNISSIGYNYGPENSVKGNQIHIPDSKYSPIFSTGLKVNYPVFSKLKVFFESRINFATAYGFSGNLIGDKSIQPDAYWGNLIGLELNFADRNGKNGKRLGCPRFY